MQIKKDTKEKKDAKKGGISFIIMAYWINVGSRGLQALLPA